MSRALEQSGFSRCRCFCGRLWVWACALLLAVCPCAHAQAAATGEVLTHVTSVVEFQSALQRGAQHVVVAQHMTLAADEWPAMLPAGSKQHGEVLGTMFLVSKDTQSITGICTEPDGEYAELVGPDWKPGQCVINFVDASGFSVQRFGVSPLWMHNVVIALSGGLPSIRFRTGVAVQAGGAYMTDVSVVRGFGYTSQKAERSLEIWGPAMLAGVHVRGMGPSGTESVKFYEPDTVSVIASTFEDNTVWDPSCVPINDRTSCSSTTVYTQVSARFERCLFLNNTGMDLVRNVTVRKRYNAGSIVYSDVPLLVRGVMGEREASVPLEAACPEDFLSLSDRNFALAVAPVRAALQTLLQSTIALPQGIPSGSDAPADGSYPAQTPGATAADAAPGVRIVDDSRSVSKLLAIVIGAIVACTLLLLSVVLLVWHRQRVAGRRRASEGAHKPAEEPGAETARAASSRRLQDGAPVALPLMPSGLGGVQHSGHGTTSDPVRRTEEGPLGGHLSMVGTADTGTLGQRKLDFTTFASTPSTSSSPTATAGRHRAGIGTFTASREEVAVASGSEFVEALSQGRLETSQRGSASTSGSATAPQSSAPSSSREPAALAASAPGTGWRVVPRAREASVAAAETRHAPALEDVTNALDTLYKEKRALLGRWHVRSPMHRRAGGQGVVQFVHDEAARQDAVIKLFLDRDAFDREAHLYRHTEVRGMMAAVVRLEANEDGAFVAPDGVTPLPPFIVLEKGESLSEWAMIKSPDYVTCLQVLVQIVERLSALHAAGYVHRDLKPGNILWTNKKTWTLIDFGCAVPNGSEAAIQCSLAYAPPEVASALRKGRERMHVDASMDMWSLGIVIWELLTGEPAFGVDQTMQDTVAALTGDAPLPWESGSAQQHRMQELGMLKSFVRLLLSRDSQQRPAADELLAALNRRLRAATTTVDEA